MTVHTGGFWKGTEQELAKHIRPVFELLVPMAQEAGIDVAITTFSSQPSLIRKVLALRFKPSVMERIVIRGDGSGSDPRDSWAHPKGVPDDGKVPHMCSAALAFAIVPEGTDGQKLVEALQNKVAVLVDDDEDNVDAAIHHKMAAVLLHAEAPTEAAEGTAIMDLLSLA